MQQRHALRHVQCHGHDLVVQPRVQPVQPVLSVRQPRAPHSRSHAALRSKTWFSIAGWRRDGSGRACGWSDPRALRFFARRHHARVPSCVWATAPVNRTHNHTRARPCLQRDGGGQQGRDYCCQRRVAAQRGGGQRRRHLGRHVQQLRQQLPMAAPTPRHSQRIGGVAEAGAAGPSASERGAGLQAVARQRGSVSGWQSRRLPLALWRPHRLHLPQHRPVRGYSPAHARQRPARDRLRVAAVPPHHLRARGRAQRPRALGCSGAPHDHSTAQHGTARPSRPHPKELHPKSGACARAGSAGAACGLRPAPCRGASNLPAAGDRPHLGGCDQEV
jgi:hypothetical protein